MNCTNDGRQSMMADREKVIKEYEEFVDKYECFSSSDDYVLEMHKAVLSLLKEQEDKIRQLRLALQIMNGNGIRVDTEGR